MFDANYSYGREVIELILDKVLPALLPWELWSNRKVSDPVRIEDKSWIYDDVGQIRRPVGVVHAVHSPDDNSREVFTWWSGGARDFNNSVFLKPGRTSDKESEVVKLIDDSMPVPADLKDLLRAFDSGRGWPVVEAATLHS